MIFLYVVYKYCTEIPNWDLARCLEKQTSTQRFIGSGSTSDSTSSAMGYFRLRCKPPKLPGNVKGIGLDGVTRGGPVAYLKLYPEGKLRQAAPKPKIVHS